MHSVGQAHRGGKHGADLARPDEADGNRTARSLPFDQHGVEIHGVLRSSQGVELLRQTNRELSSAGSYAGGRLGARSCYCHTARGTKISVEHSASFGARPFSRTCARHFCSDRAATLFPVWNPLRRQAAAAGAWQSGAPFCAAAQRSRTVTMRAFGNPMTASVASLATSRVSLANWSNVACVPCKSVLNLVVPSLSQWPIVSTKPGWKTESGAGAGEGLAADSAGCWLGILPGGRRSCAGAGAARPSAHTATTARAIAAKEQASNISGWLVIPIPSTSQPGPGWAGHVAKMR